MICFSQRSVQVFNGLKFVVDPVWKERLERIGLREKHSWDDLSVGELVSTSGHTSCYRIELDDGAVVYFKRYSYPPKRWHEFVFRPGKAAVEAWAYSRLREIGIPTLEIVAFGERRIFGLLVTSFIVTREVPETQDLSRYGPETWYHLPASERKRVYREVSGRLIEQMQKAHSAGFFHHDLKWRNILLQQTEDGLWPVWIDAPRASGMHLRRRRGMVVDLSGLARVAISLLSKYDRMRFICKYLGDSRKPGDASKLYQDVANHLGRRMPTKPILHDKAG
jgi:tRNA A-37 threonylcarbamoyl transferase component Bud32